MAFKITIYVIYCSAQSIEVKLRKSKPMFWPKPCLNPETRQPLKYQWLKKDAAIDDSDDEDVKFEENSNEFKNEDLNFDYENVRDVSEDESDKGLSDEQDSSEGLSGSDDYF